MTKWERNQDILKHIKNMSDLLDEANAHPSCIDGTWASSFDASLQVQTAEPAHNVSSCVKIIDMPHNSLLFQFYLVSC